MFRHILILPLVVICLILPESVFGQMEFISPGERAVITAVDFATTVGKPVWGAQVLYTADGRVGLGGLFALGGSPTTGAIGAQLLGSIVVPTRQVPLGLEAFFSYSYIWASVSEGSFSTTGQSYRITSEPGEIYYSGNSMSVGTELYLSFPLDTLGDALQPFVGVARSFQSLAAGSNHSNQAFYSFAFGCDAVEALGRSADFVMVPGATYEEEHTYFDLSLSVAFRLN